MSLLHKHINAQPTQYQAEVLKMKRQKASWHKNSKMRHPIRTAKGGYSKLHSVGHTYWQKGQALGQAQLHNRQVTPIYTEKSVGQYVDKHTTTKQKVIYGTIIGIVLFIIMWGILH